MRVVGRRWTSSGVREEDKREREKIRERECHRRSGSVPNDKKEGEDKRECHVIDPHLSFSTNRVVEFNYPRIVCFLCTVDRIESNGLKRICVFPKRLICRKLSNYTRQITDLS
jgi:hypothetical protein